MDASTMWFKAYNLHYKGGRGSHGQAVALYKQIISTYPNSDEAGFAKQQLSILRSKNLDTLEPDHATSFDAHATSNGLYNTPEKNDSGTSFGYIFFMLFAFVGLMVLISVITSGLGAILAIPGFGALISVIAYHVNQSTKS
ncbi:hypothetical protein KP003_06910 [Geomonas nitrogeniifigens]|uniref:tetratricopeptide repeat protein n=1 Tax=Geomonas diazotrophica TaxID=2843197 RepID=UPI001C2CBAF7|nr:hypothetical protein [Geomonas nitrogeniifigens]QXE88122.1 hypothetical protein KP003_06910 [Geomonas nitrogeniifigens]